MSIRLATIGAGAMAREHIRAFMDIPDIELVGIHSRTPSKAEALAREFGIAHVCANVKNLYDRSKADLAIVAVPELAARCVSEAVFAHPWSVLMEKPAGYNLSEAEAITRAARENNRTVWVGLNRRFLSSTQTAWRNLETTNRGKRLIHVQDQQSLETARAIGHPEVVVANWMYANSIHLIDYLRFFGRGAISAVSNIWSWRGPQTSAVLTAIDFASGDRGVYEGIWNGPGPWAVTVTTPEIRWELRPLETAAYQPAGERTLHAAPGDSCAESFKPGFRRQADEVVKALRGEPSQMPTLEDATETMRLIHSIYQLDDRAAQAA